MSKKMKGINCCGECVYYSLKKHKCTRGFHEGTAQDSFFTDCDLPDVQLVKRGEWIFKNGYLGSTYYCSECEKAVYLDKFGEPNLTNFCPDCGAHMKRG